MTQTARKFLKLARWSLLIGFLAVGGSVVQTQQPPQPPPGFVPAEQVPESEQIPAINLVAAAYGFVWAALFGYVMSLASRIKKVERELGDLEKRGR